MQQCFCLMFPLPVNPLLANGTLVELIIVSDQDLIGKNHSQSLYFGQVFQNVI